MTQDSHEKEPVKVFLRIRPLKSSESSIPYVVSADRKVLKFEAPNKNSEFSFSSIYDGHTSQKDFFEKTVLPLLEDFITGLNCLVFTYGVTNSGKTYTLQGIPSDPGILPRALDVVFSRISNHCDEVNPMPKFFNQFKDATPSEVENHEKQKQRLLISSNTGVRNVLNETMISGSTDREVSMFCPSLPAQSVESTATSIVEEEPSRILSDSSIFVAPSVNTAAQESAPRYSIWVSFLEIYNEKITDLLAPANKNKSKALKLHEDSSGNTFVGELSEIKVNSAQEACQILAAGQRNLKYSATSLNQNSSRSHCIFNIKLAKMTETGVKVSLFSFCDLAGSERQSKAKTTGVGMKETGKINASMLQLGQCLKQLRENCEKKQKENKTFVAFRNSKLTHLFQNVLQGSGRAVMIVNIASDSKVVDETFNALKLSAVAQKISTKAALTAELPKIVPETPAVVKTYRSALGVPSSSKKCKLSFDRKAPLKQIQEDVVEETVMMTSPEISSIHSDEIGEDGVSGLLANMSDDEQRMTSDPEDEEGSDEDSEEESSDEEEDWEYWKEKCRKKDLNLDEKQQTIHRLLAQLEKSKESMNRICEYYECKLDKNREDSRKQKVTSETTKEQLHEVQQKLAAAQKELSEKEEELQKARHEISIIAFDRTTKTAEDEMDMMMSHAAKIEELQAALFKSDELCAKLMDDKDLSTKNFEDKIQELETEIAKFSSKERDFLSQNESLTSKIQSLEAELDLKSSSSVTEFEELKREKQKLVDEIEKGRLGYTELQQKYDQLMEQLAIKDNQLAQQQVELAALRDRLMERPKQENRNSRKRSLAKVSRSRTQFSESFVSQLDVSQGIDLISRDLDALVDSQPVLKKELKEKLLEKENQIEEMKEKMEIMSEGLEMSQVQIVQANQILRRSNVLTTARDREIEKNRAKKMKLSSELSEKTETIKELLDQIETLKGELTSQKNETKKHSDKIKELQQSIEDLDLKHQLEISQLKENMNSLTSLHSGKGETLPKSSREALVIATSVDCSVDDPDEPSPGEPIMQSTCMADTSINIDRSNRKASRRPPIVPRGKGKKVAAIRKNFELSSRKSVAKPLGKRRKRTLPQSLSNVPENSILEILEPAVETSYNLRKGNKVSSGTCTTPSLDESTFYATGVLNDSPAASGTNSFLMTDDSTTTSSNSKRGKRRATKPKKTAQLFKPSDTDNLDVTQDANDLNNLVNTESISARTRRKITRRL